MTVEKNPWNQSNYYENHKWLLLWMEAIPQNQHFLLWAKMNGAQRRALVSPWRMHYMYSSMAKGTSWVEEILNSENIKLITLAIAELH